jgi:hypothetical protein
MRRALVVALLLACSVAAGTARADGDPASDYLLGQQVFLPFDAKLTQTKQEELAGLVSNANRAGYKIRVAVIWSLYDLGSVTSLWRKPTLYSRFLGQEIQFVYKQRLLVVMPNGFGLSKDGKLLPREAAVLSTIKTSTDASALVDAAKLAVQKLAAQAGVQLATETPASAKKPHRTAVVVLIALAGLAVLVLLRLALRRR